MQSFNTAHFHTVLKSQNLANVVIWYFEHIYIYISLIKVITTHQLN